MDMPCAFCKKKLKKSVKFGLGKRSNISLPRIGGSHPVPSLSRETGYSNVLKLNWHTLHDVRMFCMEYNNAV